DFFNLLETMEQGNGNNVIMFLGANIGNFSSTELKIFLQQLDDFTSTGDRVLIGFDLKKSPEIIMKAYNDAHGHTKNFNLNHLTRLNEELGANFNIHNFEQHTEYNPITGAVKSYLVSTVKHTVVIEELEQEFSFEKWEAIYMEMSRKFDLETIQEIASISNFKIAKHFTDSKSYFVDSLWEKV
ncbi:MAG: L-histidine N(alpha)-methyltransferase, partial [Bacteroidales bacterium]|nr:L-histidine N(alpha)-methyltransferase [Bacteroidales bacterium]